MPTCVSAVKGKPDIGEQLVGLWFALALGVPTLCYWAAIAYAAWELGGWCAAATAAAFIAVVVLFALSVARASGRCSRREEGLGDGA